jgi:non-ribosomal peptide synthetase component F/acyl carrier protein
MVNISESTTIFQGYQLSLQQKQLWQLQQKLGVNFANQCWVSLEGELNVDNLYNAIQTIGDRAEILKTTFQQQTGLQFPLQVIAETAAFSWKFVDLTSDTDSQQRPKLATIQQVDAETIDSTNLEKIGRVTLVALAPKRHLLLLSVSALCCDRKSLYNLVAQIREMYACGSEATLAADEDIIQYLQVSEWQQELLSEEDAQTAKSYWCRSEIANSPRLRLAAERETDNFTSRQSYTIPLDRELSEKFRDCLQYSNAILEDGLLASWQILLWRLTQADAIALHYYSENRPYPELHNALGYLAKALPLCTSLAANLRFDEVLEQAVLTRSEALEWQDYSETGIAPLASIGFEFYQQPCARSAAGVTFTIEQSKIESDRSLLKLTGIETETGLKLVFDYNQASFDSTAIERLAEELQTLLLGIVHRTDCTIAQLPIVGDRERHYLCVELNQTQQSFPQQLDLHHLFEQQVQQFPERPALQFGELTLTYSQLNQKANQLAHHLQQQGIGPEKLVAIALGDRVHGIIAILATLKAGGAYVPLDTGLPVERLAAIISEVKPAVLIAESSFLRYLDDSGTKSLAVVEFDTTTLSFTHPAIPEASTDNPPSSVTPANLGYIIFTSGSTGKPKGVAIARQQVLNYLYGLVERLQLPADAHYATPSSLAADLGNTALFAALCRGGCLHILTPDCISNALAWGAYTERHPIDCLKIVPSHLAALLATGNPHQILPQQCLILGGEAAPWALVQQVYTHTPNCKIVNHYGPTESTIGVLTYTINATATMISNTKQQHQPPADCKSGANITKSAIADSNARYTETNWNDCIPDTGIVPLGRPLPNTEIYILDTTLQPVPLGVAGEIYIGGASLAREYYQQPEMTAERFVSHPFAEKGRLYRTGDCGRYRADGTIEFLGRLDNQVKIRGFRVELGEIEAILHQHSAIQEACVAAISTEGKGVVTSLAAYLVSVTNMTIDVKDVRDFLRQKLPDYMIPASFTILTVLPRTPSGKIHRLALPQPKVNAVKIDVSSTQPRNAIESEIAAIWAELLEQDSVSIHDNFFDLGGHSLLATQAIARLRQNFPIEIPLRYLFEAPTIAELSQLISQSLAESSGDLMEELLNEIEAEG